MKPLLPPNITGKPTLILDMDEHLIHSCEMNGYHKNMALGTIITIGRTLGQNLRLNMRERPYLRTFLSVISEHFELVLFTAGEESYARKVIEIIDPDNHISHHLFRRHCTAYSSFLFVKDLKHLGRDMTQVAIMDNSSIAYASDFDNAIPMYPWRGNAARDLFDVELIEVIPFLLKMKKEPNFQTFLKKTFRLSKMKRALQNHGLRNL
jgi:Dullard-like phosphatase family protein